MDMFLLSSVFFFFIDESPERVKRFEVPACAYAVPEKKIPRRAN